VALPSQVRHSRNFFLKFILFIQEACAARRETVRSRNFFLKFILFILSIPVNNFPRNSCVVRRKSEARVELCAQAAEVFFGD